MKQKICPRCKNKRSIEDFYEDKSRPSGRYPVCNECRKPYRETHKEETKEYMKNYRKRNPTLKMDKIYKSFGFSYEEYQEKLVEQDNICLICKKQTKLVVDHCHKTNYYRGVICNLCNAGLGCFYDDTQIMQNAINYLKEYNELWTINVFIDENDCLWFSGKTDEGVWEQPLN